MSSTEHAATYKEEESSKIVLWQLMRTNRERRRPILINY